MDRRAATCPRVVFIGGTGRCGTSILRQVLGHHPQVGVLPFEYRFLVDPDGLIDFLRTYPAIWSPYIADRRLKRLERLLERLGGDAPGEKQLGNLLRQVRWFRSRVTPRRYHGWALETVITGYAGLCRELIESLREFSYPGRWMGTESYRCHPVMYHAGPATREDLLPKLQAFTWTAIERLLQRQRRTVYVEDNTWNILFANDLLELVPDSVLIHVHRDPRDVVASFVKQRWCPSEVRHAISWYRSLMDRWLATREGLPDARVMDLALEDLVEDPDRKLADVCRFAGLNVMSGLDRGVLESRSQGRWRRDFEAGDQALLANRLNDLVSSLGYQIG